MSEVRRPIDPAQVWSGNLTGLRGTVRTEIGQLPGVNQEALIRISQLSQLRVGRLLVVRNPSIDTPLAYAIATGDLAQKREDLTMLFCATGDSIVLEPVNPENPEDMADYRRVSNRRQGRQLAVTSRLRTLDDVVMAVRGLPEKLGAKIYADSLTEPDIVQRIEDATLRRIGELHEVVLLQASEVGSPRDNK